jgi:hypothetical protein
MNEQEWLTSIKLSPLLDHLYRHGKVATRAAGRRKLRLFAVACCRRVWHLIPDGPARQAVLLSERFADGECSAEELEAARLQLAVEGHAPPEVRAAVGVAERAARQAVKDATFNAAQVASLANGLSAAEAARRGLPVNQYGFNAAHHAEAAAQAGVLREVFGPLGFRAVAVAPEWLDWNDGVNRQLARSIYDDRDFARLPVLADGLEEAGCTDAELLAHCRQPGEHFRGCWVVDLLLGNG